MWSPVHLFQRKGILPHERYLEDKNSELSVDIPNISPSFQLDLTIVPLVACMTGPTGLSEGQNIHGTIGKEQAWRPMTSKQVSRDTWCWLQTPPMLCSPQRWTAFQDTHPPLGQTWLVGGFEVHQSKRTGQVCVEMGIRNQPAIFGGAADPRLFPVHAQARRE